MKCDYCHHNINSIPFHCKYCQEYFCSSHRLPEDHNCIAFKQIEEQRKERWKHIIEMEKQRKEDELRRELTEMYLTKEEEEEEQELSVPFLFKLIGFAGAVALGIYILTKVIS